MLVIYPTQGEEQKAALCAACGVTPRPGCFCYQAYERETPDAVDGTFLGVCQFDIGEAGTVYDLRNAEGVEDEEALFIMGRQSLNFIDLCGAHYAFFEPQSPITDKLLYWLGFSHKTGKWEMDLEHFFEEPCKHKTPEA